MRVIACMKCNRRMQLIFSQSGNSVFRCDFCNIELSVRDARPNLHVAEIAHEANRRYPRRIDQPAEVWTEA